MKIFGQITNQICSDELERQLKDSKAKVIITCGAHWHTIQKAIDKLQRFIPVVIIKMKVKEELL